VCDCYGQRRLFEPYSGMAGGMAIVLVLSFGQEKDARSLYPILLTVMGREPRLGLGARACV
jgi:hypothetical protein